jgi:hypothetical protein
MNIVKFRPVGQPSGEIVRVRISQCKRAIYGQPKAKGNGFHPPQSISVKTANRAMLRKGFVRAGGVA